MSYWTKAGVFTLADAFGDTTDPRAGEIEAFVRRVNGPLLDTVKKELGGSKPRVGATFTARHPGIPAQVSEPYLQIRKHLASRTS
ncbi:hypothetical protein BX265_7529 [Streptomyces sp. TLI_235]|nr:hypothetical protein [Streptomyces sp. TLI_235]PBC70137.1 hypothetical protein BX265_7529 [Streptomyces sp. TLI_235]